MSVCVHHCLNNSALVTEANPQSSHIGFSTTNVPYSTSDDELITDDPTTTPPYHYTDMVTTITLLMSETKTSVWSEGLY